MYKGSSTKVYLHMQLYLKEKTTNSLSVKSVVHYQTTFMLLQMR